MPCGYSAQRPERDIVVGIVISPEADPLEKIAAEELSHYLGKLYSSTRFVVSDEPREAGLEILLGCAESFPEIEKYVAGKKPAGAESYVVTTARVGGRTMGIIFGSDPRGTVYGVFRLLEKLGCGFYLSFDTIPPERQDSFSFDGWDLSDAPLVRDRIVFNWHNFLSGCSTWNLADWERWIVQVQKMGYNGVMVHAYGNNPMVKFSFNGVDKPVGYLSTTQKGRDWSTQHVNDVRRLWGGFVFDGPVFGAEAAMTPDADASPGAAPTGRAEAAERLMHGVFACAERRDMDVYFAVDVDAESANPQAVVKTLPPEARFAIGVESMGWMNQPEGKMWLANPDAPEGYRYYKAQVETLLNAYPQIDCLAVWFRHDNTPWIALKAEEMPEPWRKQYESELEKTPEAANFWKSHNCFALSKVVTAFERALKEIGRGDVRLAVGSWRFDFLPGCDRFLPAHIPFIPLDWDVLNDRSQLRDTESRKAIRQVGARRPVLPVVWAHHDDGNYVGRSYTPHSDFYSRLADSGASGFGIIHWTTRPLDLYFTSIGEQVWMTTENRPLRLTCGDVAARWFGPGARDKLAEYLYLWVTEAPKIGRETSDYFIDRKLDDVAGVLAGYEKRMKLIEEVDASTLEPAEKDRLDYFKGLEQFILDVHKTEEALQRSRDLYKAGDSAGARRAVSECRPEEVIERYARFSSLGGITRGEQGLAASMNLRWLTHYIRHRQTLGAEPVRYNFAPTSHDPLAQSMGTFTFHFDADKNVWECLGTRETGAQTFVIPADVTVVREAGIPAAYEEICHTGIESDKPITVTMQPIMAKGGRGQANVVVLPTGKYRLTLLMLNPPEAEPRAFDVQIGAGQAAIVDRVEITRQTAGANGIFMRSYPVELQRPGRVDVVLKPIVGKVNLCGAILEPLSEDDNTK